MKLFTYFSEVPDLKAPDELKLICLWRERWKALGFEPFVLNEWQARKHPYFEEFNRAVSALPSINPKLYELACYHRHLALAQTGGGWLADYDVMPYGESEALWKLLADFDQAKVHVLQTPCCPAVMYASAENALRLCQEFAKGGPNNPQGGVAHQSDQYTIEGLIIAKADWVEAHDVVKQYPDAGWETAALVHYPNAAMTPNGRTPKWKHVPLLRK